MKRNVLAGTAWYSLFFNKCVFQENKICNFKIHLFSLLRTKQKIKVFFLNKAGENFNLAKISLELESPTLKALLLCFHFINFDQVLFR